MVSFSCLRVNTTMMHILRVAGHTRGEWDRVTSLWYQWLWFAYQNLLRTTQTAVLVGRNVQYDGLVHKTLDFNQWNARHCGWDVCSYVRVQTHVQNKIESTGCGRHTHGKFKLRHRYRWVIMFMALILPQENTV